MLILLIFVVLAQFIGREVMLLGAFLGGLLLSVYTHKARSLLLLKLDGMGYGFFIPVFFIMVGIRFDPIVLAGLERSLFLFLGLFLVTLYAVKVIPSLIWIRLFGFRKAIAGGFLISSRLSLIIAASAIGLQMGLVSPEINAAVILMAIITCILSPILYNQISPRELMPADKLIIIGGSSTGVLLARRFQMHNRKTVIVERDPARYCNIESKGLKTFHGDGSNPDVYTALNLFPFNYIVVVTGSDDENLKICEMLRTRFRHERVIAIAPSRTLEQTYNRMGVETIDLLRRASGERDPVPQRWIPDADQAQKHHLCTTRRYPTPFGRYSDCPGDRIGVGSDEGEVVGVRFVLALYAMTRSEVTSLYSL
ncbi:MAG: cation:proton antiporter [Bacteroidales bacterium]|nr:cation:proton antiporter [Bacteroidales bacterium]